MLSKTLALALAPLLVAVNANVDFDLDDVPNECKTICGPMGKLSDQCDVDLKSDIDRDENRLQAQCVCTNKSFDVSKIAALCADCMHQSASKNKRDDDHADQDDLEDIDNLMATCGFASTKYDASATSAVAGINVKATKPTDISQLTTTLDGSQSMATGASSSMMSSGGSMMSSSMMSSGMAGSTTMTDSTGGVTTMPATNTAAGGASGTQSSAPSGSNAAGGNRDAVDQALYVMGAFLAGNMLI